MEFVAEAMQVYRDFEFTMADGLNDDDLIGHFDDWTYARVAAQITRAYVVGLSFRELLSCGSSSS